MQQSKEKGRRCLPDLPLLGREEAARAEVGIGATKLFEEPGSADEDYVLLVK